MVILNWILAIVLLLLGIGLFFDGRMEKSKALMVLGAGDGIITVGLVINLLHILSVADSTLVVICGFIVVTVGCIWDVVNARKAEKEKNTNSV